VFDVDYDGTIGPTQIYVQLTKAGTKGRYFYGKKSAFLELAGSATGDGTLELRETSGGKTTGTFTLKRDGDDLRGNWHSADEKRELPVSLKAISRKPGEKVLLVTKVIQQTLKASEPASMDTSDASTCDVDVEYFQVLGLSDRALQAKLDQRLSPPARYECTVPGTHFGRPTVYMNERGVLSVDFGWGFVEAGRARGESDGRHVNALVDRGIVDLPTSSILQVAHLESVKQLLEASVNQTLAKDDPQPVQDSILDSLVDSMVGTDTDIRLAPDGIVFCAAAGFPQAFDALEGCHYRIPFTDLAKVLVADSPARFLWTSLR
jgi:hypothetical protein